jgi:hypothetical protein
VHVGTVDECGGFVTGQLHWGKACSPMKADLHTTNCRSLPCMRGRYTCMPRFGSIASCSLYVPTGRITVLSENILYQTRHSWYVECKKL